MASLGTTQSGANFAAAHSANPDGLITLSITLARICADSPLSRFTHFGCFFLTRRRRVALALLIALAVGIFVFVIAEVAVEKVSERMIGGRLCRILLAEASPITTVCAPHVINTTDQGDAFRMKVNGRGGFRFLGQLLSDVLDSGRFKWIAVPSGLSMQSGQEQGPNASIRRFSCTFSQRVPIGGRIDRRNCQVWKPHLRCWRLSTIFEGDGDRNAGIGRIARHRGIHETDPRSLGRFKLRLGVADKLMSQTRIASDERQGGQFYPRLGLFQPAAKFMKRVSYVITGLFCSLTGLWELDDNLPRQSGAAAFSALSGIEFVVIGQILIWHFGVFYSLVFSV